MSVENGFKRQRRIQQCLDVEKLITNVTIKDAPFELSDAFLLQHIKMHGDVVEDSLRRGIIK